MAIDMREWSTTVSDNGFAYGDGGAPEGWSGEQVNDAARARMAAMKAHYNAADWSELTFELSPRGNKTLSRTSDTTFDVLAVDATSEFSAGRLCRVTGATVGICQVVSSSFSTDTTVTVRFEDPAEVLPLTPTLAEVHSMVEARTAMLHDNGVSGGLNAQFVGSIAAAAVNQDQAVINGDMSVDQRNAGAATATISGSAFASDRWIVRDNGATMTAQRVALPLGFALDERLRYSLDLAVSVIGGVPVVEQYIEDVRRFAGETVTVSFLADIDTGDSLTVSLVQYFGSGGSASASVTKTSAAVPIAVNGGSFALYSVSLDIDSVVGKTINMGSGILNEDALILRFTLANALRTWRITGVQVDPSNLVAPRVHLSEAENLARCQRYYTKSYASDVVPGTATFTGSITGVSTSGGYSYLSVPCKVELRTTPAVTVYNPSSGLAGNYRDGGGFNVTVSNTYDGRSIVGFDGSGGFASTNVNGHFVADSEWP